jgi:hypothetical protein
VLEYSQGKYYSMSQETLLIAPCGMNCGICRAYLREHNVCPGCRGEDTDKAPSCLKCIIKNCPIVQHNKSGFCFECPNYPCKRLKDLDKRYRTKYSMSMIENLAFIKEKGLSAFIEKENERWRCKKCGGVICVHSGSCFQCGEKAI